MKNPQYMEDEMPDEIMKTQVIQIGFVDKDRAVFHFDFERKGAPDIQYECNDINALFRYCAQELALDKTLRDHYKLTNVGRVGWNSTLNCSSQETMTPDYKPKRKMTLLEQAKTNSLNKHSTGLIINDEVIELVFAWLKDEVKDVEVRRVLSKQSHNLMQSYPTIARALKQAYRQGKLTLRD